MIEKQTNTYYKHGKKRLQAMQLSCNYVQLSMQLWKKHTMTPAVTALLHRLRNDTLKVKHSYYEWSKTPTYCHTAWVNEALQVGAVRLINNEIIKI